VGRPRHANLLATDFSRRGRRMSPSEIASIASAVSGLTATLSLIYVGIQTRLNVRHNRALIQQGTAARTTSILLGWMNPEAVAAWIEGNGGTPTPELIRERQFHYHCGIAMIAMEDYFTQHELGLLSDEQFLRGSETFRDRLREPGLRSYWSKQRILMLKAIPKYCAYIDSLCTGETGAPRT
jgi:hypothetical protein